MLTSLKASFQAKASKRPKEMSWMPNATKVMASTFCFWLTKVTPNRIRSETVARIARTASEKKVHKPNDRHGL